MCAAPALFNTLSWEGRRANGAMMIVGSHAGAGVGEIRPVFLSGPSLGGRPFRNPRRRSGAASAPAGLVTPVDPMRAYTEGLNRMAHEKLEDDALRPLLGLHVIVDASGGAGGLLRRLPGGAGGGNLGQLRLPRRPGPRKTARRNAPCSTYPAGAGRRGGSGGFCWIRTATGPLWWITR